MTSTLSTAFATAISKSLMNNLPAAMAEHFDLDEEEATTFVQEWLAQQLKGAVKAKKAKVVGTNGKGKMTGYLMFANSRREVLKKKHPDEGLGGISKLTGKEWGKLTDKKKAEWKAKADAENEENGLTPTPAAGKGKAGSKGKTAAASAKGKTAAKGKAPAKGKKATPKPIKLTRNKDLKCWVIDGTNFVVQSQKDKTVIGKIRGDKAIKLSAADIAKCEESGWAVKAAPAKGKAAPPPAKGKGKKKVIEEEEGDDDDEEEEEEGEEDDEGEEGDDEEEEDDEDDE